MNFLPVGSAMGTSEVNAKRLYDSYLKHQMDLQVNLQASGTPMEFQAWLVHYKIAITS